MYTYIYIIYIYPHDVGILSETLFLYAWVSALDRFEDEKGRLPSNVEEELVTLAMEQVEALGFFWDFSGIKYIVINI